MKTVVGVFQDRVGAERAAAALCDMGIAPDRITLLTPGDGATSEALPVDEGEAPGTGPAIGAAVGAAVGGATALPIAAAFAVPGVGPVIAAGLLGAAIVAAAGTKIGSSLETTLQQGVPKDEALAYVDELRRGRSVVVALSDDDKTIDAARALLDAAGALSLDGNRRAA
jgi:hypothetical protein